MCGIAGIIPKKEVSYDLHHTMQNMLQKIAHRGPDGQGFYHIPQSLILGHTRLAILDLSSEGHQPMHSQDEKLSIIFNGEIYNYLEIKQQLLAQGYHFHTQTDTEVILQAYRRWGFDCVQQFNGMWAFAILDKEQDLIFCSRDRFGVKPFYFLNQEQHFVFCSEIKGLLPFLTQKIADQNLIIDFLLTQKTDHTDKTFFKNIVKLPASHHLIYNLKTHDFHLHRYYELQPKAQALANEYVPLLEDAVKLRLRSDVPVGTCLSGGLDSSSVATLAASLAKPKSFDAITAISEQASNDESQFASSVVSHCGLNWHTIKPHYTDFTDSLDKVVLTQEEPFASPSIVMQYFVMQEARKNQIPVLLDGQGGDETLLGYERYQASQLYHILKSNGLFAFVQALLQAQKFNQRLTWMKTAQFIFGTHAPKMRYYMHKLQQPYLQPFQTIPSHLYDYSMAAKNLLSLQKLELETTNLPALLRFEDKNSMAHSIETRLPFLDYRLVELALGLSFEVKIHQGWSKWILRDGMQNRLPHEVVWRKTKFGFEAPEAIWLKNHQNMMMKTVLDSALIRDLSRPSHLKSIFSKLSSRTQWRLYSLALWEKTFEITGFEP